MSGLRGVYDNMSFALREYSQTMARIQEQMTTGSKVSRASDGPADALQVMSLQDRSSLLGSYAKNLQTAMAGLGNSWDALDSVADLLQKVAVLLEQGMAEINAPQRASIAEGIDAILEQVVALANGNVLDRYIFSGDSTAVCPYAVQRTGGRMTRVTYEGSLRDLTVPVAPGVEYAGTVVGEQVFRCDDRQAPEFLGNTGAKAGTGTSTVQGDVWLTLVHGTTTYAGATGVVAGADSSEGDTIIGTSHSLTIDADNNLVKLDDGQFTSYDVGTDDNLRLQNAAGDIVYVDMTGLDGGLSGTVEVAITASGKLSIDDLASSVDLTSFPASVLVPDIRTGRILYVDASGIERTGQDPVRVKGTCDLFGMLITARDALLNDRNVPRDVQHQLLTGVSASFEEVKSNVITNFSTIGARVNGMESLRLSQDRIKESTDEQAGLVGSADTIELTMELAQAQTYYQMLLAATSRMLSISLLDYL